MNINDIRKHINPQTYELKYVVFARTEQEYLFLKMLGFTDLEIIKEYKNNS